jgi:hypothetical protein
LEWKDRFALLHQSDVKTKAASGRSAIDNNDNELMSEMPWMSWNISRPVFFRNFFSFSNDTEHQWIGLFTKVALCFRFVLAIHEHDDDHSHNPIVEPSKDSIRSREALLLLPCVNGYPG